MLARLSDTDRRAFREGARDYSPTLMAIFSWGLVTGIAMSKSALTLPQALTMSLLCYAGSSQLAVLPLLAAKLPIWTVLLTAATAYARETKLGSIGFELPKDWKVQMDGTERLTASPTGTPDAPPLVMAGRASTRVRVCPGHLRTSRRGAGQNPAMHHRWEIGVTTGSYNLSMLLLQRPVV